MQLVLAVFDFSDSTIPDDATPPNPGLIVSSVRGRSSRSIRITPRHHSESAGRNRAPQRCRLRSRHADYMQNSIDRKGNRLNEAVTEYIANVGKKPGQEWETPVCEELRALTLAALPGVEERMQYGKPHYLVNKQYAAVIGTAKQHVSFTIFNAAELDAPAGLFEDGPPERRTVKIKNSQNVDYTQLAALLEQAAATIA